MRISPVLPLLFVSSLALCACSENFNSVAKLNDQPFGGTNEANLAAMVANPSDLVHGRSAGYTPAKGRTLALERLETDQPKPLPVAGKSGGGSGG